VGNGFVIGIQAHGTRVLYNEQREITSVAQRAVHSCSGTEHVNTSRKTGRTHACSLHWSFCANLGFGSEIRKITHEFVGKNNINTRIYPHENLSITQSVDHFIC